MSKVIEDEIYLMVFGMFNGAPQVPSTDLIRKTINNMLQTQEMISQGTGKAFPVP